LSTKTGTLILKRGLKSVTKDETFVLAFITVNGISNPWSKFKSAFFNYVTEAQGSKVELNMLLTHSYANSLKKAWGGDYSSLGMQKGYLYPSVPAVAYYKMINLIEKSELDQRDLDLVYKSNRVGNGGKKVSIKRLYVGKVYEFDRDKELVTLKMRNEYRSFKLSRIETIDEFNRGTKAALNHLKITFSPMKSGGTRVAWEEIYSEDDPILAQPWDESEELAPLPVPAIVETPALERVKKPTPKKKLAKAFDYLAAEDKLNEFYDEMITIVEKSNADGTSRTSMKLKGFRIDSNSTNAAIFGDGGITVHVDLRSISVSKKADSKVVKFF